MNIAKFIRSAKVQALAHLVNANDIMVGDQLGHTLDPMLLG